MSLLDNLFKQKSDAVAYNWHEDFIVHVAQITRPKVYVELGLYHCELFNRIIPYAGKLMGVDIDQRVEKYMKKTDKSEFICAKTLDFAKQLKKNPITIDLLFIDADHSAQAVKKDFEAFFPYVSDNGVILLHDAYPENEHFTQSGYCGDGYKTIAKLSQHTDAYEMMTIPIPPGLTLCRKRKKHLAWKK